MLGAALKTARSAGILPAFGWVLLAVALLAAAGGTWLGARWERGTQAIADNARLKGEADAARQDIDALVKAGKQLQQQAVDDAAARQAALDRQDEIATRLEDTLDANNDFLGRQRSELADLLDRRPDLRDLHLGDDVLQHWNQSNAGAAAGGSTAEPAARPAGRAAPVVPRAPRGAQRPGAGPAGQPRPGGEAVSRLRGADRQPGAVDRRVGDDRLALVLRRHRTDGSERRRLRGACEVSAGAA